MRRAIAAAASVAAARGDRVYLVGGAVRDLLLGRTAGDLDLAIDGDGDGVSEGFARELAERLGGMVRRHDRFGTATLTLEGGGRLDLAATRRETYEAPGALPRVELGASIEEDLARRDFSIHAMAVRLGGGHGSRGGALLDLFGGREDLARRRIRFLHADSPIDDPTRALRAVRYARRLGFRVAPEARRQILRATRAGAFRSVSGDRLRRELTLIFAEGHPIGRLHELGLDEAIAPGLACDSGRAAGRFRRLDALRRQFPVPGASWLCYLLTWMAVSSPSALKAVADRLALPGRERQALLHWARTRRRLRTGLSGRRPSLRRAAISGLSADEVLAAAALLPRPDARGLLSAFQSTPPELAISGEDLLSAGLEPGPAIGRALAAARLAREDGRIGAAEELAFALRAARRFERRR